jgi:hypothetical protein
MACTTYGRNTNCVIASGLTAWQTLREFKQLETFNLGQSSGLFEFCLHELIVRLNGPSAMHVGLSGQRKLVQSSGLPRRVNVTSRPKCRNSAQRCCRLLQSN